jgi:hypothetical protein
VALDQQLAKCSPGRQSSYDLNYSSMVTIDHWDALNGSEDWPLNNRTAGHTRPPQFQALYGA